MPHRPIGIFDSGIGGISVLREIHKQLPNEDLIYVADSAYAPYGDKDENIILQRSRMVIHYLLKQNVKAVVIACNTATAIAAICLRKEFPNIDIIGLEPAVKPAVEISKVGKIGILATEQTIKSQRLANLIADYGKGVKAETQACSGLVEQVEMGEFSSEKTQQLLAKYINPMLEKGIDTLVLGCTHYPFLISSIRSLTNGSVTILETSIPVSQQLSRILSAKILESKQEEGSVRFYSSENSDKHKESIKLLWQKNLNIENLPSEYC